MNNVMRDLPRSLQHPTLSNRNLTLQQRQCGRICIEQHAVFIFFFFYFSRFHTVAYSCKERVENKRRGNWLFS